MDLIYDPSRPNAQLVTDSMVIRAGQRFTVPDARGRSLLAQLYPDVREAPAPKPSVVTQKPPAGAPQRPPVAPGRPRP